MTRRFLIIMLLLALAACSVAPPEQDGGIGGTGAPAVQEPAI